MFKEKRVIAFIAIVIALAVTNVDLVHAKKKSISIFRNSKDTVQIYLPSFETIMSKKPGDTIQCKSASDFKYNDLSGSTYTIVQKGATAFAKILELKKPGAFGKEGYVKLNIFEVMTKGSGYQDSGILSLDKTIESTGENKRTKALMLLPIGWLIKGGKPEIDTDTPVEVPIRYDDGSEYLIIETQ